MFTASNTLSRAQIHFIPIGNSYRYYYQDRYEYRTKYLKSYHWKQLRLAKLTLTPLCEECGDGHRVEPHHLRYKNLYDVQVSDLQTLCRKCHVKKHLPISTIKRKKRKHKLRNIFRNRTQLIKTVSRRTGMSSEYISQFLSKRR
jgi:5-methylcytosine-specific restriction endonuclease McrA